MLKIVPFLARECRFGAMIAFDDFDQFLEKSRLRLVFQNTVPGLFHGMSLKPRSSAKIKITFGLLQSPFATRNVAKNEENRSIAAGFL